MDFDFKQLRQKHLQIAITMNSIIIDCCFALHNKRVFVCVRVLILIRISPSTAAAIHFRWMHRI